MGLPQVVSRWTLFEPMLLEKGHVRLTCEWWIFEGVKALELKSLQSLFGYWHVARLVQRTVHGYHGCVLLTFVSAALKLDPDLHVNAPYLCVQGHLTMPKKGCLKKSRHGQHAEVVGR